MPKLLALTNRNVQTGKLSEKGISSLGDTYTITSSELKLTDAETQMLKHDIVEIRTSFAQLGLMVVGLIPGWGEPADATSAAIDFATGHPIAGTISAFCACPVVGCLGDVPLLGIRIYRITSSTLKCAKTMFVIAKTGNRVEKIFIWSWGKVIEVTTKSKAINVIQKNVFDPNSTGLYKLFPNIEKAIKSVLKDQNVRNYGGMLEYCKKVIK